VVSVVIHLLLLVFFHDSCDRIVLVLCFLWSGSKLSFQKGFSNKYALLVDDVIELCVFNVKHLVFILVVFVIILIIDFVFPLSCIDALDPVLVVIVVVLVCIAVQLLKDVLDLSLELLIALFHQVLENFWHTKLLGLFLELLACEDRVESTVDISSDLKILMLNEIIQNIEKLDVWLFTLVFSCVSERQVHQQSGCILNTVICQLVSFVS
jgi:hypothetical protein